MIDIFGHKMEKTELTQSQVNAIRWLLECNSIDEAAKRAHVSRSSVYNWLKEEPFRETLRRERETMFTESLGVLKQATGRAVRELLNLLDSSNETTRRLAAREILCQALRATEIRELEERLLKIEEHVGKSYVEPRGSER
jgi:transposase